MGRLIRKKTSAKKKSQATLADKSLSPQVNTANESAALTLKAKTAKGIKTKKVLPLKKSSKPAKQNIIDKSLQFLREVRVELKKVTWPSRKQTIGSTVVVLILVMIISLFLGVVDMGLSGLIRVILK
jgi:preprotein translocase subunit SecE